MTPRVIGLASLAAVLLGCSADSKKDVAKDDAKGPAMTGEVTLTAAQVRNGKIAWDAVVVTTAAVSATVPGQLVPSEDRTARLGAPAGGRVTAVLVSPGDMVTRGQVLATLQSPEAGMAQSDLRKAQSELSSRRAQAQFAKNVRDRAERLLALKSMPRQDYERAIADDDLARAAVVQAESEHERARTTVEQLGANASASGEIAIRSPQAGAVLTRSALTGTVVESGAPLIVVTDPSTLWLQVNAPESFAALFRRGGRLRFTVPAYPADTFSARIDALGAGLDPATRTLPVRGVVASSGNLKPEMLATVIVEGASHTVAAMLPADAVQLLDGKRVVFVATPDGKGGARFRAQPVEVGGRTNDRVAITSGLNARDIVVTAGAFTVKAQLQKSAMPEMVM